MQDLLENLKLFLKWYNPEYAIFQYRTEYKLYYKKDHKLKFSTISIKELKTYLKETMLYDKYFSCTNEYDCLLDFIKLEFPTFSIKPVYNSFGLYNGNTLIVKFDYRFQIVNYFKKNYAFSYKRLYPYICKHCHKPFERIEQRDNAIIYSCKYCYNETIELL